jgi:hypothetical protein
LTLQELRVRDLNDRFRQSCNADEIFITRSVQKLPPEEREQLVGTIRAYKAFKKEDDPYGRNDSGSIKQNGVEYFWTINYYNRYFSGAGAEPSDTEQAQRILAIMQMREYGQNRYNTDAPFFLRGFVRMK